MNPSLYFSRIPVSGSRAVPGQIHRLLLQIMNSDILVPTEDAPGLKVHRISPFNTLVELSALEWESGEEGEGPTQGEWLESENEVQSDHPDIQKAVEVALSAVEMDRRTDNLRALLNWLNKNVLPSYRPEITDALGALKAGAAGGPGRTALFTALARAAGIPARRVAGLVHRDGYLSYNEWAEVWHGGWRPVDPGRGALHLSGEYMRLAVIGEQFDLYRTLDVPQALKVQLATLGGTFQDVLLMEDGGVLFGQNEASGDGLLFRTETMEILFPLNYGEMRELSPDGIFKAMNRVVQLGRYSVYLNHEIGISFERPSGGWVMQATEKSGGLPANQGPLVQLSHRDNRQLLIALHSDPAGHPTEMYGQHITGQVMSSEPGGQLSPKQWLQISKSNRGVLRYEAFLPASRERGVPERTALHYFMKVGGCNLWLRAVASKGEATQLMEKAINEILASFRTIPKVKVPRR
jgi:hypothetical protein